MSIRGIATVAVNSVVPCFTAVLQNIDNSLILPPYLLKADEDSEEEIKISNKISSSFQITILSLISKN